MRVSIPTRIFAAFSTLLLVFGAVSVHGAWALDQLGDRLGGIHRSLLPLPPLLSDIKSELRAIDAVLEPRERAQIKRGIQLMRRAHPALEVLADRFTSVRRALELGQTSPAVAEQLQRFEVLDVRRVELTRTTEALFDAILRDQSTGGRELASEGEVEAAAWAADRRRVVDRVNELGLDVSRFEQGIAAEIESALDAFAAQESRAVSSTLVLTVIGLAVGLALTLGAGLTLRPLRTLRDAVERMARGDFDALVRPDAPGLAARPGRARSVTVDSEIGDLAADIGRLAEAIRKRDLQLALQQKELLHQERLATVGRLAAQITHELRNPLSSIGLNSELLMEELDHLDGGDEARTLLSSIIVEVERLREITEAYLGFARLPRPEPVPCDLNAIAGELLEFVRPEMERARIRTRLDADRAVRPALADPHQVRAALLNLVRNAREALAGREGHLVLRVRSLGDAASIEVVDDGPGFSADAKAHLYEPFYSTRPQGTGLGLSYVRKLIQAQGGGVEVEDAPGGGALVRLCVPLALHPRENTA